ncbi:organic cation transporter protein-like [Littorina saxatilis]|uniref:Major facilitator superfamily (MFS) profile domain-containing protein n=1 Tax=Littorina saxatilis TaxID=31220 RepID=A0AAN9GLI5_9CAEN
MAKDELHLFIGEWGPYQRRLFFLLALPLILKGFQIMQSVIVFHVPDHRCQVPGLHNDTFIMQNEHHRQLVNLTVPKDEHTEHGYAECSVFTHWNTTQGSSNETTSSNGTDESMEDTESCQSWVYDFTDFDSSFITQFNLVCEKKQFRSHLNMIYMAGNSIGGPLTGLICDWVGRKTVFCIANMLNLVIGVASAFPPSPEVFFVYRFLMGVMGTAIYLSAFVLAVEFVGPKWRTTAGSMATLFWLTGPFLVAGLSYFVRHWQYIQLIGTVPLVLCIGHWWLLPESPRWLLLKKGTKPAMKVIRRAARANKLSLPPSVESTLEKNAKASEASVKALHIVQQLLQHPRLLIRTLIIFFNWCVISMTYYGLSLNVGNLSGSLRLNFLISSVMELAGYLLAWFLLERLGRKRSHCCFMLVAGTSCLSTIFTVAFGGKDLGWATTALAMVGKLGISASYTSIYLISAELFPTVMRNFGMGCSVTLGTIGGVMSPYVADLALLVEGRFSRAVPLVVFGGLGILAGLSSLFLPETLHRKMPDTMEDAVNFKERDEEQKDAESAMKTLQNRVVPEHIPLYGKSVTSAA